MPSIDDDAAFAQMLQAQMEADYLQTGGIFFDDLADGSNNDSDDGSDTEWGRSGSSRPKKKAKKITVSVSNADSMNSPQSVDSRDSKRKTRKDAEGAGSKRHKPAQKWTEEEHVLFLEGLERYGRDWEGLAGFVGNRDKFACKSHAQKHFLKLYLTSSPLPEKVKESGDGFTLSGKPLDPESKALKAYSNFNYDVTKAQFPLRIQDVDPKLLNDVISARDSGTLPEPAFIAPKPTTPIKETKAKEEKKASKSKKTVKERVNDYMSSTEPSERRKSSRRRNAPGASSSYRDLDKTNMGTNMHAMVHMLPYSGTPGSGAKESQPFSIKVDNNVTLMMDLHSHLCNVEVIGLFAGFFDKQKNEITISKAFPCRSIATDNEEGESNFALTNVEIDPTSELEVREHITQLNMCVVGWYHSHPTFKPIPSVRDCENQNNYQILFSDAETKKQPFVGAIVGPYDVGMPTEESIFTWYYVDHNRSSKVQDCARSLEVEVVQNESLTALQDSVILCYQLVEKYKDYEYRVLNWNDTWRECETTKFDLEEEKLESSASGSSDNSSPSREPVIKKRTYLEKMKMSLCKRVCSTFEFSTRLSVAKLILEHMKGEWKF
eukprot:Nk52_evm28s123 gene=Nk52_evmTU28s123